MWYFHVHVHTVCAQLWCNYGAGGQYTPTMCTPTYVHEEVPALLECSSRSECVCVFLNMCRWSDCILRMVLGLV